MRDPLLHFFDTFLLYQESGHFYLTIVDIIRNHPRWIIAQGMDGNQCHMSPSPLRRQPILDLVSCLGWCLGFYLKNPVTLTKNVLRTANSS